MFQMLTKCACKESQTGRLSTCFPIPINFTFIRLQIKNSSLLSHVKAADFHTPKNKQIKTSQLLMSLLSKS